MTDIIKNDKYRIVDREAAAKEFARYLISTSKLGKEICYVQWIEVPLDYKTGIQKAVSSQMFSLLLCFSYKFK